MKIIMQTSGYHDGRPFAPGDTIDTEEQEALALIGRGLAVAVEAESDSPPATKPRGGSKGAK